MEMPISRGNVPRNVKEKDIGKFGCHSNIKDVDSLM